MAARKRHWWAVAAVAAVLALVVAFALNASTFFPTTTASTGPGGPPPSSTVPSAAGTAAASNSVTATSTPTVAPPSPAPSKPAPDRAQQKLASMTMAQKVGQLLMVAAPVTGPDPNTLYALDTLHVGNIFMKGRSAAGQAGIAGVVSAVTSHVSGARTNGVRPFVSTDQEGGFVQIMSGPGFSTIPQAIVQGQEPPAQLQAQAATWGLQLASAGVNVDLAPVLDTVPSAAFAPSNAPIGLYGREYGYSPAAVSAHGVAFARGMMAAGVDPAGKHFPGLGRVTANTDTSSGVTDDITVRGDAYIAPFRDAVNAGIPWLMVSNAFYPKIDPVNLAPFSPVIISGMMRGDLGFRGVIVSDDICDAVQVSAVPVAQRAVNFINAGGTMALCTDQAKIAAMYEGTLSAATTDPAFAAKVNAAALLVLETKSAKGLF